MTQLFHATFETDKEAEAAYATAVQTLREAGHEQSVGLSRGFGGTAYVYAELLNDRDELPDSLKALGFSLVSPTMILPSVPTPGVVDVTQGTMTVPTLTLMLDGTVVGGTITLSNTDEGL